MNQRQFSSRRAPVPLAEPDLSGREAEYLMECVRTNFVSSVGPFVTRFEEAVAASCDAGAAVAVSSGTAGLHLALVCVGVGAGDLVIAPSFTFIASANAIAHCGASPWLFDIEHASWTLDLALLEDRLRTQTARQGDALVHRASGRRVAALMPVYTLGTPADMEKLNGIARQYRLPVVADAAAALGATYKRQQLAPLADLTVFSFNGNKTVTSGGGGAIVGTDRSLLARARHLCAQARVGAEYVHDAVGYNYRMTNLEAAVGLAQMERCAELVARKQAVRATYDRAFSDLPGVSCFPQPQWCASACWLSGLSLAAEAPVSPDELRAALDEQGIAAGIFWRPVHLQEPYRECPRTQQQVGESIAPTIVILPCSTSLSEDVQARVIDTVREHLLRPRRAA